MLNGFVVIVLMLIGGIVGGTVNHLNLQEKGWRFWWKQVLTSTAAALLVPLFLALTKSDLLKSLLDNKHPLFSPDVFVFFSFCLLGGIASNRFIVSLSDKILQEVKQTKEEVSDIRKQTEPLLEQITEPDTERFFEEQEGESKEVDEEERKVLEALRHPHYKLRTISGIAVDTHLPREEVQRLLHTLKSKGLVMEVAKTRRRGIRWAITSQGLKVLKEVGDR